MYSAQASAAAFTSGNECHSTAMGRLRQAGGRGQGPLENRVPAGDGQFGSEQLGLAQPWRAGAVLERTDLDQYSRTDGAADGDCLRSELEHDALDAAEDGRDRFECHLNVWAVQRGLDPTGKVVGRRGRGGGGMLHAHSLEIRERVAAGGAFEG